MTDYSEFWHNYEVRNGYRRDDATIEDRARLDRIECTLTDLEARLRDLVEEVALARGAR